MRATPLFAAFAFVGGMVVQGCPGEAGGSEEQEVLEAVTSSTEASLAAPEVGTRAEPGRFQASLSADLARLPDIAEGAVSSVVNIATTRTQRVPQRQMSPFHNDPFFREFFGPHGLHPYQPRERHERSLGSGVVVSADGVVLTNNHVVEGADEIQVTLSDGNEYQATVVGTDPKSDVAVIRLVEPADDLVPLPLGDSNDLRLGEVVLAIGNPFGVGQTVTMGIVSAKGRAEMGILDYEDFIQTDAAINPGNSGGALVNMRGDLVGISTAIVSQSGGYQGIGFAIPSNMAKGIMDSLLADGRVERGWLGVAIQDLDPGLAEALELNARSGVLISDVTPGSPAEAAGIERGDVITHFNDEAVDSSARLRNLVAAAGTGAEFEVQLIRDGRTRTLRGTLGELSDAGPVSSLDEGSLSGLTVAPLVDELRHEHRIPERIEVGVVVTQVEPGSAAERSGLREGDVIVEVNRNRVGKADDFREIYQRSEGRILLLVYRQGATVYLVLRK